MRRVLLLLAHSIEEYDQVRLLSGLGYDVFSLGAYIDPAHPLDDKRPAIPEASAHPDLKAIVDALGQPDNLDAAKVHIPAAILDWADVIIDHHYPERWLLPQWNRLKGKRVIWRTVGQSTPELEYLMGFLRRDGLQIVRYSPKERNLPNYAGEDALIRFYKDPAEWYGWTGEDARVLTIVQHSATPHERDAWLNWSFWEQATEGLPRVFAGPHTELAGGLGTISLEAMKALLRSARCYLYMGTQPASYTLGLIEAMMTGIPVVSIGPSWMTMFPWGPDLFEGQDIVPDSSDDPVWTGTLMRHLLANHGLALDLSEEVRVAALDLFGRDKIASEWQAFLG